MNQELNTDISSTRILTSMDTSPADLDLAGSRSADFYDEAYFQRGKQSGKSLYTDYRWLPELTRSMAKAIVEHIDLSHYDSVVDFGCARGYLVRALVEMKIDAYGLDISQYAITNCDSSIQKRVAVINDGIEKGFMELGLASIDWVIAKDVFEHITPSSLTEVLDQLKTKTKHLYVIVPLGDQGSFRIKDYEQDPSHVIAENEIWWSSLFVSSGFSVDRFNHFVPGVKEEATKLHAKGNGHFLLSRA